MKQHATIGAELLDHARSPILQMAREIALSHHERWDGAGYPQGIAGREIPESARIVAIADVFDALSHDRVYRPAFPEHEVVEMLSAGRGTQFDPDILDCFLQHLPQMIQIAGDNPDHTNDVSPAMSAAIGVITNMILKGFSESLLYKVKSVVGLNCDFIRFRRRFIVEENQTQQ